MNIYSAKTTTCFPTPAAADPMSTGLEEEPEILASYGHHPSAMARRLFNVVLCSGHFRAWPGYRFERRRMCGHELLFCVGGSGHVLSERGRLRLESFELAWLPEASTCWAREGAPWEVLWMCVEGHQIEQAREDLSAPEKPIFKGLPKEDTARLFHRVNDLLRNPPATTDAALNCCVAQLLGYLVQRGEAVRPFIERDIRVDYPELHKAFTQLAADAHRSWRAAELARLCGLSERHFFRRFKEATGLSPITWLKHQRIRLAQEKLREGARSIKEIAEEVGYNDVFFFSRDFKRHTGFPPSGYRRAHTPLPTVRTADPLASASTLSK